MDKEAQRGLGDGGSRLAREWGPRGEDAERHPRPSARGSGEQSRLPGAPAGPPSTPTSPLQPPMRAGSRLRVWRSFLLDEPGAEEEPEAGDEQEKTLCSRLCADIAAGTRPRPPSGAPGRLAIGGRRGTGGSGDAAPLRGGGGRCRAHVPAAHYKWPGGGRSRSIPRLLGKGSGVHGGGRGTRTFPGARAARGSGRGDGRSALAGSRRRPASAALPSSRGRRLLAPAPCLWAASKSPAGSSSHPEDGGGGLGTRPPGHAPRARRCSRGSEGDFLPRWSRAPGLRRGARSPSPGAPEAAGRASPGPLRPLLQRVRRKDVSPLLGPRGASLATERGPGARFARGLPRTELAAPGENSRPRSGG